MRSCILPLMPTWVSLYKILASISTTTFTVPLRLLNTVLEAGVRKFVFSSTCAVYGVPQSVPITEDFSRQLVNPYGVTKLFFENALEAYDRAYGLRFVSLRYFNAAGAMKAGI